MTAKELAKYLDGCSNMKIMCRDEVVTGKGRKGGLVVVTVGSSVEFNGAKSDEAFHHLPYIPEVGLPTRADVCFGKYGGWRCGESERNCFKNEVLRNKLTVILQDYDRKTPKYIIETDIPHEKFTTYEDGSPVCEGIVFSMRDLK